MKNLSGSTISLFCISLHPAWDHLVLYPWRMCSKRLSHTLLLSYLLSYFRECHLSNQPASSHPRNTMKGQPCSSYFVFASMHHWDRAYRYFGASIRQNNGKFCLCSLMERNERVCFGRCCEPRTKKGVVCFFFCLCSNRASFSLIYFSLDTKSMFSALRERMSLERTGRCKRRLFCFHRLYFGGWLGWSGGGWRRDRG